MATLPDPTECPCRNRATKTMAKFGANANMKMANRCIIESIIIEHLRPNFPLCNAPPNEPEMFPSTMILALIEKSLSINVHIFMKKLRVLNFVKLGKKRNFRVCNAIVHYLATF